MSAAGAIAPRGVALLALALASAGLLAAEEWLPPRVEEAMAEQLRDRLAAAAPEPLGESEAAEGLEMARELVADFRGRLEGWGVTGTLERTPRLAELELPGGGSEHLDALARYNLCNLVLMLQYRQSAEARDPQSYSSAAIGLTAMTMTIVYLREPFVTAGGTDEQIERFLTSEAMERAGETVQSDQSVLDAVASQCGVVLAALFGAGSDEP